DGLLRNFHPAGRGPLVSSQPGPRAKNLMTHNT
ncbi:hypothetical protein ACUXKJ_001707, partial [Micrococcus aloeverae]